MNHWLNTVRVELKQALINWYGDRLVGLWLFGSQARGDANDHSDVDVLVVLRGGVHVWHEIDATGGVVAQISLKHNTLISTIFMSETEYQTTDHSLLTTIHKDVVPL